MGNLITSLITDLGQDLGGGDGVGHHRDDDNFQHLDDGSEESVHVPWLLLPLRHIIRGIVPKWTKFTYFNDERRYHVAGSALFASHYQAYRSSLLYAALFFSGITAVVQWVTHTNCHWKVDGVDADCDVIPSPYRTDPLLRELRRTLYRLSFVPVLMSIVMWLCLFLATVVRNRVRMSRNIVLATFIVGFCVPFTMQLVPFRALVDFRSEFEDYHFQIDLAAPGFGHDCTPSDNTPACVSLVEVCRVAQQETKLIDYVQFLKPMSAAQRDELAASDSQVQTLILLATSMSETLANNMCFSIFNTPCNLRIPAPSAPSRAASEADNEDGQVVDATVAAAADAIADVPTQFAIKCEDVTDNIVFYWDSFAGVVFGARAVSILAPAALSLIPAIAKGAKIVKYLCPSSTLTAYLTMFKPAIFTPLFIALAIGMYQAIGDVWFALAMVFLTLAQAGVLAFGRGTLAPMTIGQTKRAYQFVLLSQLMFGLLAVACICISFFSRNHYFEILERIGVAVSAYRYNAGDVTLLLLNVLSNLYVGALTMTDMVMLLVIDVYERERVNRRLDGRDDAREDLSLMFQARTMRDPSADLTPLRRKVSRGGDDDAGAGRAEHRKASDNRENGGDGGDVSEGMVTMNISDTGGTGAATNEPGFA